MKRVISFNKRTHALNRKHKSFKPTRLIVNLYNRSNSTNKPKIQPTEKFDSVKNTRQDQFRLSKHKQSICDQDNELENTNETKIGRMIGFYALHILFICFSILYVCSLVAWLTYLFE